MKDATVVDRRLVERQNAAAYAAHPRVIRKSDYRRTRRVTPEFPRLRGRRGQLIPQASQIASTRDEAAIASEGCA
jgi:hypothetical protein